MFQFRFILFCCYKSKSEGSVVQPRNNCLRKWELQHFKTYLSTESNMHVLGISKHSLDQDTLRSVTLQILPRRWDTAVRMASKAPHCSMAVMVKKAKGDNVFEVVDFAGKHSSKQKMVYRLLPVQGLAFQMAVPLLRPSGSLQGAMPDGAVQRCTSKTPLL